MLNPLRKLALVGYGKMNRLVEQLASEYNFEVVSRIASKDKITPEALNHADAAIEFSTPQAASANLIRLAELGIPTVTGTTGWLDRLPTVSAAVEQHRSALVWSPNFSTGVAVFRRVTALAAQLLESDPEYSAWAWEIHHDQKKDAPSGTLLHLVHAMKDAGYRRPVDVSSNRAGRHPGTHEIGFDSASDTLTFRHTARSREGFVRGALKSAVWLDGKNGVFTFEDVLFGGEKS